MMKALTIFSIILVLSGCGPFSEWRQAKTGMQAADPLVPYIETYRSVSGKYPESLSDLSVPEPLLAEALKNEITYVTWNNRSEYGLVFRMNGILLNPHCSYGSNLEHWQCLGK